MYVISLMFVSVIMTVRLCVDLLDNQVQCPFNANYVHFLYIKLFLWQTFFAHYNAAVFALNANKLFGESRSCINYVHQL